MSEIQLYLLESESNKSELQALASRTATNLESKQTTILNVIASLGEFLNNEDATTRIRTISYLADVLSALPSRVLSRQQRDLLNDFVLSRVSNGIEALGHCARCLLALERLGQFDNERPSAIIKTLLDHTTPITQIKQQSERFDALKLIDVLMLKYRQRLHTLHEEDADFLPRLIAYFDGEKDPRNLMIVFSILNVPMVEWDITKCAQDLFDAVFNYFPITFRPPPNDPYGITAQDLKDRLRDCISATGNFAPYAFPALLDKLDSTSANVKRDSLNALRSCVDRYGPATINLYSITLWDAIKFEILNAQEEDLAEESLAVLQAISRQLSTSPHDEPLQTFLKPVSRECNQHLEDSPTKQSSASGQILQAVAEGAAEACGILTKAVIPQILELYASADNIPRRRGLLEVLLKLVQSNVTIFGKWREEDASLAVQTSNLRLTPNALSGLSPQCLELLVSAVETTPVNEVSYRLLNLQCIQAFATVRGLLADSWFAQICEVLDNIIIDEDSYGRDEAKATAIDTLVVVARQKPQTVIETSLPSFMAHLPDSDQDLAKPYVPILEAIAKLSAEQQIFATIVVRLKNKLYAALRHQASRRYVSSILSALLYGFSRGSVDIGNPAIFGKYYQELVIPLLQDVVAAGPTNFADSPAIDDEALFDIVGRISNLVLRGQPWQAQTEVCRNVYSLFRPRDVASLPPYAPSTRQDTLAMLTSTQIVAALQQQATPDPDVPGLLSALVQYCQVENLAPAILASGLSQITLVVNKYVATSQSAAVVGPLLFDGPLALLSPAEDVNPVKLRIAFAVMKGLVLRTDGLLSSTLPRVISLLQDQTHGHLTARHLGALLSADALLSKENHCRVYAIHRQRMFSLASPQLVGLYREAAGSQNETSKVNALTALSGLTEHVPYELLQTELDSITPLMMQSLALEDTEVQSAVIATLSNIAVKDAAVLEQHVGSLVTRLLGVATPAGAVTKGAKAAKAPPRTRAAALTCLGHLVGSLRDETLVPYQRQVVKRLASALDDSRRTVRAEAVRCRAAWMSLASNEDDDDDD